MNRLSSLLAAAALAGSVSTLALAQEEAAEPPTEPDAPASMENGDTMAPQGIGPVTVEEIEAFGEGRTLTIITLEEADAAAGAEGEGPLGEIMAQQEQELGEIVEAIEANLIIFEQLEAEGYSGENIVAVGMDEEGALTIYVDGDGSAGMDEPAQAPDA